MARVDETPTYTNQCMHLLMKIPAEQNDAKLIHWLADHHANSTPVQCPMKDAGFDMWMGKRGRVHKVSTPAEMKRYHVAEKDWEYASRFMGWQQRRTFKRPRANPRRLARRQYEALCDIIIRHRVRNIYSDHDARQYLLAHLVTNKKLTRYRDGGLLTEAAEHAMDVLRAQVPYLKMTMPKLVEYRHKIVLDPAMNEELQHAFAVADAAEKLQLSWVCTRYLDVVKGQNEFKYRRLPRSSWFSLSGSRASQSFCRVPMYRLTGLTIVILGRDMYVLDAASVEQVKTRAWSNYMTVSYALNYRVVSMHQPTAAIFREVCEEGRQWFWDEVLRAQALELPVEGLARSMKIGQARFLNVAWDQKERIVANVAEYSQALLDDELAAFVASGPWSDWLISKRSVLPDHMLFDVSYMFHLAAGTDCNIADLFTDSIARLREERHPDPRVAERFLNYCSATWCMEYACASGKRRMKKEDVLKKIIAVGDYKVEEQKWFKKSFQGTRTLPDEGDWGRCFLRGAFPYNRKAEFAWLGAQDVTHVNADWDDTLAMGGGTFDERIDTNELLYTLRYGMLLSRRFDPSEWRRAVCRGELLAPVIATLAAKAENTKFGHKVRETYSACDVFRELQSEMDHCAQNIAGIISGPTMRANNMSIISKLRWLASRQGLVDAATRMRVFTSQDVSSWSPKMNRNFAIRFYDLLLDTTEKPEGLSFRTMWEKIHVVVNKRGYRGVAATRNGNFMGFPGTSDTVMHAMICAYAANRAKATGIMDEADVASILTMIDDAVMALDLKIHEEGEDGAWGGFREERVQRFMNFLCGVYASLGFEVDRVKTVVSTTKFTFLNRVFACGTEVLTPMKIYMKSNREMRLQLSSSFDQMGSAFNAIYGAAERGADPIMCYLQGCFQAARIAFMTNRTREFVDLPGQIRSLVSLAPRSLGGWGWPTLLAWVTKDTPDDLSEWFSVVNHLIRSVKYLARLDAVHARVLERYAAQIIRIAKAFYHAPLDTMDPATAVRAIRVVRSTMVTDPMAQVRSELMTMALSIAQAPEVIAALTSITSEPFLNCIRDIAHNSQLDAAVWDLMMDSTPMAAFSGILDKARKNDLLTCLLSRATIGKLKKGIQWRDQHNMLTAVKMWLGRENEEAWVEDWPGATYAYLIRERYYDAMGMRVLNHTEPVAMDVFGHVEPGPIDIAHSGGFVIVTCAHISQPRGCSRKLANMFDGWQMSKPHVGIRTKGQINVEGPVEKTFNPVSRALMKLALACRWLDEKGANPAPIWDCVTGLWMTIAECTWPEVAVRIPPGVSSKRLSNATRNVTHPIAMFPNTLGCIQINMGDFGNVLKQGHYRHDFAALVQSLRAMGLLDRFISGSAFQPRFYGIFTQALGPVPDTLNVVNTSEEFVRNLVQIVPVFAGLDAVNIAVEMACEALRTGPTEMQVEEVQEAWNAIEIGGALSASIATFVGDKQSGAVYEQVMAQAGNLAKRAKTRIGQGSNPNDADTEGIRVSKPVTRERALAIIKENTTHNSDWAWSVFRLAAEAAFNASPRCIRKKIGKLRLTNDKAREIFTKDMSLDVATTAAQRIIAAARNTITSSGLEVNAAKGIFELLVGHEMRQVLSTHGWDDPFRIAHTLLLMGEPEGNLTLHYIDSARKGQRNKSLSEHLVRKRQEAALAKVNNDIPTWISCITRAILSEGQCTVDLAKIGTANVHRLIATSAWSAAEKILQETTGQTLTMRPYRLRGEPVWMYIRELGQHLPAVDGGALRRRFTTPCFKAINNAKFATNIRDAPDRPEQKFLFEDEPRMKTHDSDEDYVDEGLDAGGVREVHPLPEAQAAFPRLATESIVAPPEVEQSGQAVEQEAEATEGIAMAVCDIQEAVGHLDDREVEKDPAIIAAALVWAGKIPGVDQCKKDGYIKFVLHNRAQAGQITARATEFDVASAEMREAVEWVRRHYAPQHKRRGADT